MEKKIGFQEWLFGPRYRFLVGGGVFSVDMQQLHQRGALSATHALRLANKNKTKQNKNMLSELQLQKKIRTMETNLNAFTRWVQNVID